TPPVPVAHHDVLEEPDIERPPHRFERLGDIGTAVRGLEQVAPAGDLAALSHGCKGEIASRLRRFDLALHRPSEQARPVVALETGTDRGCRAGARQHPHPVALRAPFTHSLEVRQNRPDPLRWSVDMDLELTSA